MVRRREPCAVNLILGSLGGDNIPPSGSMTPANGSNVSGSINIVATVADNDQVASVQFKIDGANLGALQTTAPFQVVGYDTHLLTIGGHTITAVVTDRRGNVLTINNSVTNVNSPPGSGNVILGDWQLNFDGSGYSSGRNYLPNFDDRDGSYVYDSPVGGTWDWIWQNVGARPGYLTMPTNPDPTHYQMQAQLVGSRLEGGNIGLIINGVEQATVVTPTGFSYQGGPVYNLSGGESLGGKVWLNGANDANELANTFFEQGIGLTYWFVIKAGYNS